VLTTDEVPVPRKRLSGKRGVLLTLYLRPLRYWRPPTRTKPFLSKPRDTSGCRRVSTQWAPVRIVRRPISTPTQAKKPTGGTKHRTKRDRPERVHLLSDAQGWSLHLSALTAGTFGRRQRAPEHKETRFSTHLRTRDHLQSLSQLGEGRSGHGCADECSTDGHIAKAGSRQKRAKSVSQQSSYASQRKNVADAAWTQRHSCPRTKHQFLRPKRNVQWGARGEVSGPSHPLGQRTRHLRQGHKVTCCPVRSGDRRGHGGKE